MWPEWQSLVLMCMQGHTKLKVTGFFQPKVVGICLSSWMNYKSSLCRFIFTSMFIDVVLFSITYCIHKRVASLNLGIFPIESHAGKIKIIISHRQINSFFIFMQMFTKTVVNNCKKCQALHTITIIKNAGFFYLL